MTLKMKPFWASPAMVIAMAWPALAFTQCLGTVDVSLKIGDIKEAFTCWKSESKTLRSRVEATEAELQLAKNQLDKAISQNKELQTNSNVSIQSLREQLERARSTAAQETDRREATARELSMLKLSTQDGTSKTQELDQLRKKYVSTQKMLDEKTLENTRSEMLSGGTKMGMVSTFNSSNRPYFKSARADVQFVDGMVEFTEFDVTIDTADAKMPNLESGRFKLFFWLYYKQKDKFVPVLPSFSVCCWESEKKIQRFSTVKPIKLSAPAGQSIGELMLAISLESDKSTASEHEGVGTERLKSVSIVK